MHKPLVPAFLLVLGSVILGATVLHEPLAKAASPFTNVIVGNTSTNPVPVAEQGTPSVSVTNSPTVSLGQIDAGNLASANNHLAAIDSASAKLGFDGAGNLNVDVAKGATADPTPASEDGFGVATAVVASHSSTTMSRSSIIEVTAFSFWSNNDAHVDLSNGSNQASLRVPLHGGIPIVLSLAHALPADRLTLVCDSGSSCDISFSVTGY